MLALSLSDKFCYFGIFVFVFVFDFFVFVLNRFLFFRFSFVFVFIIFSFSFSFSLTNSLFFRFSTFSFSFSLTKITLVAGPATISSRDRDNREIGRREVRHFGTNRFGKCDFLPPFYARLA